MKAKQLKKGKATKIDNMPRESFIPGAGVSSRYLCVCYNEAWKCQKGKENSKIWKRTIGEKALKKRYLNVVSGEELMLLSVRSKLLSQVILNRRGEPLERKLRKEQSGFKNTDLGSPEQIL